MLVVDAGNFATHTRRIQKKELAIQRRKVELILDGLNNSSKPLTALGIGDRDLLMGGEWLLGTLNERQLPSVLTNLDCEGLDFTKSISTVYKEKTVEFLSFVSPSMLDGSTIGAQLSPASMLPTCEATTPIDWLQAHPKQGDVRVAFADLNQNEISSIAPYVDIVIESKIGKTTSQPQRLDSDSVLVGVGSKGKNIGVLTWQWEEDKTGFSATASTAVKERDLARRRQRLTALKNQMNGLSEVELEQRKLQRQVEYTERAIAKLEADLAAISTQDHQTMDVEMELKALNRQIDDDPVIEGLISIAQQDIATMESQDTTAYSGPYVGSQRCQGCHSEIYDSWKKTPHSSAWETLVSQHREMDPSCFSCHSTGGGMVDGPQRPSQVGHLTGVGCESCHGAGQKHVLQPKQDNIQRVVPDAVCVTCHNGIQDNGEFDPSSYRARILHHAP